MKRSMICAVFLSMIAFLYCGDIAFATNHEPIIDVEGYGEWTPVGPQAPVYSDIPQSNNDIEYRSKDADYNYPKPESYEESLKNADPTAPDFEKYGLNRHMGFFGSSYEYCTSGYDENTGRLPQYKAYANVKASWATFYKESDYNENYAPYEHIRENAYFPDFCPLKHIDAFTDKQMEMVNWIEELGGENYEWRGIHIDVDYFDYQHGYSTGVCNGDYYDIIGADSSGEWITSDNDTKVGKRTVIIDGKEQVVFCLYKVKDYYGGQVKYDMFYYVPEGYDGCVFGLFDTRLCPDGWEEGTYVFDYMNENMLLFRLK